MNVLPVELVTGDGAPFALIGLPVPLTVRTIAEADALIVAAAEAKGLLTGRALAGLTWAPDPAPGPVCGACGDGGDLRAVHGGAGVEHYCHDLAACCRRRHAAEVTHAS